jgi:hypothetical protein
MAICGEDVCKLKAQTIIQWALEKEVMLILYCRAGADQAGPHVSRWLCSRRQVPISLHSQLMAGAPKPAEASTVARVAHNPLS